MKVCDGRKGQGPTTGAKIRVLLLATAYGIYYAVYAQKGEMKHKS